MRIDDNDNRLIELKYLKSGDCFEHDNQVFIKSDDMTSIGLIGCVSVSNGHFVYLDPNRLVEERELYVKENSHNSQLNDSLIIAAKNRDPNKPSFKELSKELLDLKLEEV